MFMMVYVLRPLHIFELLDANLATSRAHLASAPSTASGDITRALGVSSTPISNGSKHQETPHPLQAFPFKCLSALTHHCNVGSSKTRIMISKFEAKLWNFTQWPIMACHTPQLNLSFFVDWIGERHVALFLGLTIQAIHPEMFASFPCIQGNFWKRWFRWKQVFRLKLMQLPCRRCGLMWTQTLS